MNKNELKLQLGIQFFAVSGWILFTILIAYGIIALLSEGEIGFSLLCLVIEVVLVFRIYEVVECIKENLKLLKKD